MYSSEKNPGMNLKNIIIKIVLVILFVILLIWLVNKFSPKVENPNLDAFYSNVFRENISYMQDAARSYYTNDRLPKNIGESSEMTLQDLIDKNLILPFVDKNGKSCDTEASYVEVTKQENEYSLKVNLVCEDESAYIIETLGCYDYCEEDCEKEEEKTTQTQYQFKKPYTTTQLVNNGCAKGLTQIGNYCYQTAKPTSKYKTVDKLLETVKTKVSANTPYECGYTTYTEDCSVSYKTETRTEYKTETYSCNETKEEETCSTTYTKKPYDCNCTQKFVNGKYTISCNTCYTSIPKETCSKQTVTVPKTCTREVPVTKEVQVPVRNCVSVPVYISKTCTAATSSFVYSCPKGTDTQIGSGSSLKCYDSVKELVSSTECKSGYSYNKSLKLCVANKGEKLKTTTKKVSGYTYTWSAKEKLEGWTRTGKTRTVES